MKNFARRFASYGGVSHPIWTDSRLQLAPCGNGLAMEEVFTATVKSKDGRP